MSKRHSLEPITTEEGAIELLQRMVRDGYCSLEDLDEPSTHWTYNEEIATKYHPSLELRPHRNLLRESESSTINIEVVKSTNRSGVSPGESSLLLSEEKALRAEINKRHSDKRMLPEPLPF